MIIQISKRWRIESDPHQWIVEYLPPAKEGTRKREAWIHKAFFSDLAAAVVWIGRRRILDLPGHYGPDALEPLCIALQRLEEDVVAAVRGIKPGEMPEAER